jgi:hypothetical protein
MMRGNARAHSIRHATVTSHDKRMLKEIEEKGDQEEKSMAFSA